MILSIDKRKSLKCKTNKTKFMSKPTKQRLVIFLDGTWNTEDDSTNVLNAYHNTKEESVPGKNSKGEEIEVIQKRYYDRGVGTSVSDNVRGGGYGLGLEKNVREAYNWLVDNYNGDGQNDPDADEIYIFGFSRGAYTARSLVGLIAACGLVKRGAPITVTQLWNGYAFTSKNRGRDKDWWKAEMTKDENKNLFGRLSSYEKREPKHKETKDKLYNTSEKLLYNWSIRVNITYLGIYDTVGAMGVHALGIPGLSSKLDANHNLNPTSLIKKCRHALAIDEHRSSFRLTPILNYVENKEPTTYKYYEDRIMQNWFIGVHSNIGGGYANNVLSMEPYNWMMEGAEEAGLSVMPQHEMVNKLDKDTKPGKKDIRDSFAELAGAIYPHIIRAKRVFRPIGEADNVRSGSTLRSINEEIHESVFKIANLKENKDYAPANVLSYLRRHPEKDPENVFDKQRQPNHQWPGEIMAFGKKDESIGGYLKPRLLLIFWSIIAALGLISLAQFFWIEPITPCWCVLPIIASLFVLVDWGEYKVTLRKNFYPKAVRTEVTWNILYWMRLIGVLSFLIGALCIVFACIKGNLDSNFSLDGLWGYMKLLFSQLSHQSLLIAFISTTILMSILDNLGQKPIGVLKEKSIKIDPNHLNPIKVEEKESGLLTKIAAVILFGIVVFSIYKLWNHIPYIEPTEYIASGLLLIFVLIFAFPPIIEWVGKPMGKHEANLGTIVKLQTAFTDTQVSAIFNSWLYKVNRDWRTEEDDKLLLKLDPNGEIKEPEDKNKVLAWVRLRQIMRLSLWRDIIGFVPLYSFFLGIILCIGSTFYCNNVENVECFKLFGKIPLWLALVLFTAIFDMIENRIHLIHIRNFPKKGISFILVLIGSFCTILKAIGFITMVIASIIIIFFMCKIVVTNTGDLKWMIATLMTFILIFTMYKKGKTLFFEKE